MGEYKVPRVLWESLESVLMAHSRRYVSDLAKILEVDEKELIKKVLPTSDKLKVYIQDSQSECYHCMAYVQYDKVTGYCRKTKTLGSEFCEFHNKKRMNVVKSPEPNILQKISNIPELTNSWIDSKGNIVISDLTKIGKVCKEKSLIKIFSTNNS